MKTEVIQDCIKEALETVQHFVKETTGKEPTQPEIANALKRYFVLKEIKEHIELERES